MRTKKSAVKKTKEYKVEVYEVKYEWEGNAFNALVEVKDDDLSRLNVRYPFGDRKHCEYESKIRKMLNTQQAVEKLVEEERYVKDVFMEAVAYGRVKYRLKSEDEDVEEDDNIEADSDANEFGDGEDHDEEDGDEESGEDEEDEDSKSDSGIRAYRIVREEPTTNNQQATLGDVFVNAEDNSLAARLQRKPIADLTTAIGINDKFLLLNELFGGSMEKYNKCIRALNNFSTLLGAKTYMEEMQVEFQWDCESEAYKKLSDLVERRFISIHNS